MDLFGEATWTQQELAAALRLTAMRVTQLVQDGILPKPGPGHRHNPKEAVPAYVTFLRKSETSEARQREETEKLRLDNALKRLRLDRATGELMSRDKVQQAWFAAGRQIRDTLENLPDRLSGPLAAETKQEAVFATLSSELHQLLETLSKAPDVKPNKAAVTV